MSENQILLGFEVQTGKPIYLPLHHTVVFGMTRLSGKTTTLEAIITRSSLRAIAFKTKRGETGFTQFHQIEPYYKTRADWQYVEGILNVALGEKVQYQPFMRWAIQKVTEGTPKTLRDILNNAEGCKDRFPRRKEVFEVLIAYLKIVVPELEKWTFSTTLELEDGVNVMDISTMRTETQQLIIASSIEYVFQNLSNVIVIVPEAWECLPQSKMTPVKWVAEQFIRKGASVGNYLFLDSQDIGGIDKTPLRQCDNWLMGRMKEAHEVERILKQLIGLKIPREEIQTLSLGHFYAVVGDTVSKIYVLPANISEDIGVQVALGKMKPEQVKEMLLSRSRVSEGDAELYKAKFDESEQKRKNLEKEFEDFRKTTAQEITDLHEDNEKLLERNKTQAESLKKLSVFLEPFTDQIVDIVQKVAEGIVKEEVAKALPDLTVKREGEETVAVQHERVNYLIEDLGERTVKVQTTSVDGQILYSAIELSKQKEEFSWSDLQKELLENGWNMNTGTFNTRLRALVREGKLVKTEKAYRLPSKVPFNVVKSNA